MASCFGLRVEYLVVSLKSKKGGGGGGVLAILRVDGGYIIPQVLARK